MRHEYYISESRLSIVALLYVSIFFTMTTRKPKNIAKLISFIQHTIRKYLKPWRYITGASRGSYSFIHDFSDERIISIGSYDGHDAPSANMFTEESDKLNGSMFVLLIEATERITIVNVKPFNVRAMLDDDVSTIMMTLSVVASLTATRPCQE